MANSYEFSFLTSGDDRFARYRDEADHARLAALLPTRAGLLSRLVTRPARQRPATVAATTPTVPAAGRTTADGGEAGTAAESAVKAGMPAAPAVSPRVPVRS